jgi:hypothetical protein
MLLPKYMNAAEAMACANNCGRPIEPGQPIVLFRGTKKVFMTTYARHRRCIDKRTRIAQRASVRKRRGLK